VIARPSYAIASVAVSISAGVLLTACGSDPDAGTNGVGKLPPKKIESSTRAAAQSAKAVRLSGDVFSKGKKYRLDVRLKESGGVGEVTFGGNTVELLRVDKDLYLKADKDFYTQHKDSKSASDTSGDVAAKLDGKYVKVPPEDPTYKQLSAFTDLDGLLDGFFVLDGELSEGDHGKVDGVRTVELKADGGKGGSVQVSLEGKPYPLRYSRAGGAGTIELSDYNKDFTLKAPDAKHMVDYGKQVTSSG
jgi:hypothetical protein